MRITDLLKKESIDLNGVVTTKKETIEKMTLLMEKAGMSKTSKNTEPSSSKNRLESMPSAPSTTTGSLQGPAGFFAVMI